MDKLTLETYALIQDMIPMSEALKLTEDDGLVILKYKDLMKKYFTESKDIKRKIKGKKTKNWKYIIWRCPVQLDDNFKPAGRYPKKGCNHMNIMMTKLALDPVNFQSSPCKKCGKRTRQLHLMKQFSNENEAKKYLTQRQ